MMKGFIQKSKIKNQKSLKGFTLIEALVFLFLFSLISIVFLQTYSVGTRLIIESKNRLGATALANQKMEIIRSIEYDAIGTTSGIPAGDLAEDETISVNTIRYEVHTFVQYVDDSFDSTVSTGDTIPTDYKRVRVTVSWGNLGTDQTVAIFGNFSPNGVESSTGGGVLSINVLDASGTGVTGASVHIVNSAAGVDVTGNTDSTGNLMLPGAPAGTEAYTVTVSKSGYYGATTYPAYPTSSFNPVDVHASVVASALNQKTIVMDQSSDITLTTEDPFGTAIPSIGYTLTGGRVLGTDPGTGEDVTGFSDTGTTDASGGASYPGESYGDYAITTSSTDYEFLKLSPETAVLDGFTAAAGSASNIKVILLDKNIGSVLVKVQNQADGTGLAGASVQLTNTTLFYDTTVVADQYGYAYFPTALPELVAETYDISVSLAGYGTETGSVDVNGVLETQIIGLTAN
jgi:Tfp pilus assembly protein PilV